MRCRITMGDGRGPVLIKFAGGIEGKRKIRGCRIQQKVG